MAYSNEEAIEPFWAKYVLEANGRDPLAIQNSSVVIYTRMMVGITNVTNRIRYNGVYCWIIETIIKKINPKNSRIEQIRFIRRAELLLAYIMVRNFPSATGISGSAFAGKNMQATISLRDGADWEAKKEHGHDLYWKFRNGIFGQYYSSVLSELNLIHHPQNEINIYTTTDLGKELAGVFGNNIQQAEQDLFWECVFRGYVFEIDLENLTSFALHKVPSGTAENALYTNILLSSDDKKQEPTFHRRQTLCLMLQYLETQENGVENLTTSFLRANYNSHRLTEDLVFDTATAWYLFEINELLHVSFEYFHACLLYSMEDYPIPLNDLIDSLLDQVKAAFQGEGIDSGATLLGELIKAGGENQSSAYDRYELMEAAFKTGDYGKCLMNAVQTIICVVTDCEKHFSRLKEFAILPQNGFSRNGCAPEMIDDLVLSKRDLPITDCVRSILLLAVNLHSFSSYTKTRIGQGLVHNYMIEDNQVWRLRRTLPVRTTPRLQNAAQYIADIGWIKRDGKNISITEDGKTLLREVNEKQDTIRGNPF